ncbi:MAG: hypothetical protein WCJ72_16270 [Chryseobacterium sp.]
MEVVIPVITCALPLSILGITIPSVVVAGPVGFFAVMSNVDVGAVLLIPTCADIAKGISPEIKSIFFHNKLIWFKVLSIYERNFVNLTRFC